VIVKKTTFLLGVLLREAETNNFLLKAIFFGLIYFLIALLLFDFRTYQSIWAQSFPFLSKISISSILFVDSFAVLGIRDTILLIIIAFLFGLNLELVLRKLRFLKKQGSLHITFGAGVISLVSAGCASCGLSFASVIGVAGAVSLLPFKGLELYILAIIILLASLFFNLQTLVRVCKIRR
jgi:hypothetical protein